MVRPHRRIEHRRELPLIGDRIAPLQQRLDAT
jgi:hypothetical protein